MNLEAARSDRFTKALNAVSLNEQDFSSWTLLLNEACSAAGAPAVADEGLVDEIFAKFLTNFPYCFGYWNKYALLRLRTTGESGGNAEAAHAAAKEIYERGVVYAGSSADLWSKYCEYMVADSQQTPADVRAVFERAVVALSGDPRCVPCVWTKYAAFEEQCGEREALLEVYRRLLAAPAVGEEALQCGEECFAKLEALAADPAKAADGAEETSAFVARCGAARATTAVAWARKAPYELSIRRHYFHVKPLDSKQLETWRAYLDSAERDSTPQEIAALYERCLVACCAYPEFWTRYALWCADQVSAEQGLAIARRFCKALKHAPDAHLLLCELLESAGLVDEARAGYERLTERVAPGLLEAVVALANFERRCGNLEDAQLVYSSALTEAEGASRCALATHLARFQAHVLRELDAARGTLEDALRLAPTDEALWVAYFHLETAHPDQDAEKRVSALFEHCVLRDDNTDLDATTQKHLWLLYKTYMEDTAADVADVLRVRETFATKFN